MQHRTAAVLLLSAALLTSPGWPSDGWAQTKTPRIGFLGVNDWSEQISEAWMVPFFRTLREHGWIEGKNIAFEYRDAAGDPRRIAEPAAELVRLKVDVLFPVGPPSVRAAFAATRDIPIVAHDFETDPVAAGYAQSYSHPGGNLTGLFLDTPELAGKWVELLKAIVPSLSRLVVLWDATSGPVPLDGVRNAAPAFGVSVQVLKIHTPADIDKAPSAFGGHPQAMIVLPSPMMYAQSARLAQLARKHRLPATSMFVPFAEAGGMFAYGPNAPATTEQCAVLVAKILSGAKPGNLPIERPSKFEFVLNLKTARALHLTVPDAVLVRADRLIK